MFPALLALAAPTAPVPSCRAAQLRLTADGRAGDFNGMSHSGVEVSIRNAGLDCVVQALPALTFLDARGRPLPAARHAPPGMHPGPVMVPVRIAHGARAITDLRWVSGPVFDHSRALRAASVIVRVGPGVLRVPLSAVLYGPADAPAYFDQPPLTPAG